MKVQCVSSHNLIAVNKSLLTIGKWYELVKVESKDGDRIYWVIDDTETLRFYSAKRFRPTIEELRDQKIDDILSSL